MSEEVRELHVRLEGAQFKQDEVDELASEIQQLVMRRLATLDHSGKSRAALLPLAPSAIEHGGHTQGIWLRKFDVDQLDMFEKLFDSNR